MNWMNKENVEWLLSRRRQLGRDGDTVIEPKLPYSSSHQHKCFHRAQGAPIVSGEWIENNVGLLQRN